MESGKRLGRAVLLLRQQLGWTQEELAVKAGLVSSYISRLEKGAYERPAYRTLNALALAMGFPDAGQLMHRLEAIDRMSQPPDAEADQIRALAVQFLDELKSELLAIPQADRPEALQHAVRMVRQFRRRPRRRGGGNKIVQLANGRDTSCG